MSDDEDDQVVALGKEIFDSISEALNIVSENGWMKIDPDKEPERYTQAKLVWGKALLSATAQHLGIVEAALIMGDGLDQHSVMEVREHWIQAGHQTCINLIHEQQAEDQEN